MLSAFHRIDTHLSMILPVCHHIDKVDVITLAKCLPCIRTAILCSSRLSSLGKAFLTFIYTFLTYVTQSDYFCARNVGKTIDCSPSTHTDSDYADTDSLNRLGCKPDDILLACRTRRGLYLQTSIRL